MMSERGGDSLPNWAPRVEFARGNTPADLVDYMGRFGIDQAVVANINGVFHKNTQPTNEMLAEAVKAYSEPVWGCKEGVIHLLVFPNRVTFWKIKANRVQIQKLSARNHFLAIKIEPLLPECVFVRSEQKGLHKLH